MPKQTNPTGRVCIDLFADKDQLEALAIASGTTATALARILIRHGMEKLSSGEFRVAAPTLTPAEVDQ